MSIHVYMCEKHCFKFHVHVLIHSTTKHLNCTTCMCVSSNFTLSILVTICCCRIYSAYAFTPVAHMVIKSYTH